LGKTTWIQLLATQATSVVEPAAATVPALLVEHLISRHAPLAQAQRLDGDETYAIVPARADVHLGRLASVAAVSSTE